MNTHRVGEGILNGHLSAAEEVAHALARRDNKVLFILGAGASHEAGIPLGNEVGSRLKIPYQELIKYQLGGDQAKWLFFDVIETISRYFGDEITAAELRRVLKPEYISLGYEIIAHYLYHKSINCVITLNHDDAFDRALQLESPEFRWQIRSRSEFAQLLEYIKTSGVPRLIPNAYLKIHGCVSKSATFRVSKTSVNSFENEKKELLKIYLRNTDTIVCIGWAMRDPDLFLHLCEDCDFSKQKLIVVNKHVDESFESLVTSMGGRSIQISASEFMKDVGQRTETLISKQSSSNRVGLHRHYIRGLCFGEMGALKYDSDTQAAIEIVMFALKARAQIDSRIVFECNRTSMLLSDADRSNLHVAIEKQVRNLSRIVNLLIEAKIFDKSRDGDAFWLTAPDSINLNRVKTTDEANELLAAVASNIVAKLNGSTFIRSGNTSAKWASELQKYLADLTQVFDVDLMPRANDFALFSEPRCIQNSDEFDKFTGSILEGHIDAKSKIIRISTNTGEWVLKHVSKFQQQGIKRAEIIVEDYTKIIKTNPFGAVARARNNAVVTALARAGIEYEVRACENKVHQLTALFSGNTRCIDALYFRREGKTTRISPVILSTPSDLAIIGHIWKTLWSDPKLVKISPVAHS